MTDKQKILFEFCRFNTQITKRKAVELIGNTYYTNAAKHVGDVLSRMVKSGLFIRIKPGVFALGDRTKKDKKESIPENQLKLF